MKKLVAAAVLGMAALAAPLALGQSQAARLDAMNESAVGAAHMLQVKAASFFAPRAGSGSPRLDAERAAFNPDPLTSWLMALAILGVIVVRRTRS